MILYLGWSSVLSYCSDLPNQGLFLECFHDFVLLVFVSRSGRPLLRDILDVHDAAVSESIQVQSHLGVNCLLGLILEVNVQVHFARREVIRLPDLAEEHELRGYDHSDAGVLLVFEA